MTSEAIQKLFASIAPRYALANHLLSGGIDGWWRYRVAKKVAGWKPRDLLDVATGNGELAFAIAKKNGATKITGVDFCREMLALACKHNKKKVIAHPYVVSKTSETIEGVALSNGVSTSQFADAVANCGTDPLAPGRDERLQKKEHLTFLEADALQLPFEENSFDVVTIAFGLRNMTSLEQALSEMRRVLRPGGHLLILDFSIPRTPLLKPLYRFYLHHLLPRVAGWITGESTAYKYMGASIETFPSGEAMKRLLKKCHFLRPVAEPLTGGIVAVYTAQK